MNVAINPDTVQCTRASNSIKPYYLIPVKKAITYTEAHTLLLKSQGKILKVMAHESGRSESAIKQSLKSIREKLGAENTTHALRLAIEAQIFKIMNNHSSLEELG